MTDKKRVPEAPLFRAIRNVKDIDRMKEVYTHHIRDYKKEGKSAEDAEDIARRDILSIAGYYDKETDERWTNMFKNLKKNKI